MSIKLSLLLVFQTLLCHGVTAGNQQVEETDYSWEEAEGYKECEDFLIDMEVQLFNEDYGEFDESGFFREKPKPKALQKICSERECASALNRSMNSPGCGYSERILYSGNWTTTRIDLTNPNGYREAYFRLGGYRSGKTNDRNQPVGMAVPVIKKWYLDEKNDVISATMSFYVPSPYQKDPPASLDEEVTVEQWDDLIIYSRTYGGNREDPEHMEQFHYLREALSMENIKTYPHMIMTAGYTSPRSGQQRREVMLIDDDSMTVKTETEDTMDLLSNIWSALIDI